MQHATTRRRLNSSRKAGETESRRTGRNTAFAHGAMPSVRTLHGKQPALGPLPCWLRVVFPDSLIGCPLSHMFVWLIGLSSPLSNFTSAADLGMPRSAEGECGSGRGSRSTVHTDYRPNCEQETSSDTLDDAPLGASLPMLSLVITSSRPADTRRQPKERAPLASLHPPTHSQCPSPLWSTMHAHHSP